MSNYEFDGQRYRNASTHQKEWGSRIISELHLLGDETILDLGSGDGVLTKKLAEIVPKGKVIGIDASTSMIKAAKELVMPNLTFVLMDINEMTFDSMFDLIFSNAALQWVKDHKRLLMLCRTALRPGGAIRFNFAGNGNCATFFEVVNEVTAEPTYEKYFEKFIWPWFMPDVTDYELLVKCFDYEDIQVWAENADRYFKDQEEMIKWIDQPAIVPYLCYLPEHMASQFRDDVVNRMIKKTLQDDGTCFETFRRINVYARKPEDDKR